MHMAWERDQFKGGFKICVSVFVHFKVFPPVCVTCCQQFNARDSFSHLQENFESLCLFVIRALTLIISPSNYRETHFHINLSHHQGEKILDTESNTFFDNISQMGYLPTPRKVAFSKAPVSVKSQRCCFTCLFVRFEFSKCIPSCWKECIN